MSAFRQKLGLTIEHEGDAKLIEQLLDVMHKTGSDFSRTFRILADFEAPTGTFGCVLNDP